MISQVFGAVLTVALVTIPTLSFAKSDKHHHGGYAQKGKVKFFDGRCIIEQKFKKHGGYEEKRKCRY